MKMAVPEHFEKLRYLCPKTFNLQSPIVSHQSLRVLPIAEKKEKTGISQTRFLADHPAGHRSFDRRMVAMACYLCYLSPIELHPDHCKW
jgi:hypothetical protein